MQSPLYVSWGEVLIGASALIFCSCFLGGVLTSAPALAAGGASHAEAPHSTVGSHAPLPSTPVTEGEKDARVYGLIDELRTLRGRDKRSEDRRAADLTGYLALSDRLEELKKAIDAEKGSAGIPGADPRMGELQKAYGRAAGQVTKLYGPVVREERTIREIAGLRRMPVSLVREGVQKVFDYGFDRAEERDESARDPQEMLILPGSGPLNLVLGHRFTQKIRSEVPGALARLQARRSATRQRLAAAEAKLARIQSDADRQRLAWDRKRKWEARLRSAKAERDMAQDELNADEYAIRAYQDVLPIVQAYAGR